jgi:hypothetical protein
VEIKSRNKGTGHIRGWTYNFTKSSCSFFGRISSMYGSSKGYDSRTLARMPRWAEDFTLDFEPGVMLKYQR